MQELHQQKCIPCEGGIPSLSKKEIEQYISRVSDEWIIKNNKRIEKTFFFVNFKQTMIFVNQVADIAEEEGHHPVMHINYGKVDVEIWTHAINGLSENDFILAAKIDRL